MSVDLERTIEYLAAEARIATGTDPQVAASGMSSRSNALLRRKAKPERHASANRWTDEQKQFVRDTLGYLSLAEIGAACGGRSMNAVKILRTRHGWPAPSKQPQELTACQIGRLMGICWKLAIRLIELGFLPGRVLPGGRNIHVVKRVVLHQWLINPMNWIYFKRKRIRDPRLSRLVELAQTRWPDKWLTTGQAARLLGASCSKTIHARISRGEFQSARRWNNWWVLRSEIERIRFVPGRGSPGRTRLIWSKAGDRFLKKCVRAGKGWREIGRLMGPRYSEKRASYRFAQLQRAR